MGRYSPSRYRREGRDKFDPNRTFEDVFPDKGGFWEDHNQKHRRDGWDEAAAQWEASSPLREARSEAQRAYTEQCVKVEDLTEIIAGRLGVREANLIRMLIKEMIVLGNMRTD